MMTFCGKELRFKPSNPVAFVMALGYKLGSEDIMSDKPIESLPKATETEKNIGRHFYPNQPLYLLNLIDLAFKALQGAGVKYKNLELDTDTYDGYYILDEKDTPIGKIRINFDLECQIEMAFPAQAGVIPASAQSVRSKRSLSRASGGDPSRIHWLLPVDSSFPRKRG